MSHAQTRASLQHTQNMKPPMPDGSSRPSLRMHTYVGVHTAVRARHIVFLIVVRSQSSYSQGPLALIKPAESARRTPVVRAVATHLVEPLAAVGSVVVLPHSLCLQESPEQANSR